MPPIVPVVMVLAAIVLVVGVITGGGPDKAQGKPQPLRVGKMTEVELARNASADAAFELARRMSRGLPAQRVAAANATRLHGSPRLMRNMAMAMAVEAQRRQQEMQRRMAQRVRWAEEGAGEPMPDFPGGYEAR